MLLMAILASFGLGVIIGIIALLWWGAHRMRPYDLEP